MPSYLFDIKRYAINDGPGIRITLFLKGCPLSCLWCHNPEGISVKREKMYTAKKCIGCGFCVKSCPQNALSLTAEGIHTNEDLCIVCGKCTEVCPSLAMEMSGKEYTVDQLMEEIRKQTIFLDQSGGGVTFCGGEPLLHSELLLQLLKQCGEEKIHRAVDTTLYAKPETVKEVMEYTDLFLIDLKHMDSASHKKYCGVPNERILSNFRMVAEAGIPFSVRIPLIEEINATESNLEASAAFLGSLPWEEKTVNILPYHDIGKNKHQKLGTFYNPDQITMSPPSGETLDMFRRIFASYGIETVIGG